jgi:hypothetical protein
MSSHAFKPKYVADGCLKELNHRVFKIDNLLVYIYNKPNTMANGILLRC